MKPIVGCEALGCVICPVSFMPSLSILDLLE
jgi:hypothetical protein